MVYNKISNYTYYLTCSTLRHWRVVTSHMFNIDLPDTDDLDCACSKKLQTEYILILKLSHLARVIFMIFADTNFLVSFLYFFFSGEERTGTKFNELVLLTWFKPNTFVYEVSLLKELSYVMPFNQIASVRNWPPKWLKSIY